MIDQKIITHLKSFEWDKILEKGNMIEDLNDRQWRFIKGLVAELIVEKHSGPDGLKYVGQDHKDFEWPTYNMSVELKSQLSGGMYKKSGQLASKFSIKFNNSQGTNKHISIPPDQVADLLIVLRNDGAFALDKKTVMNNLTAKGDGFDLTVTNNDIVELTGNISIKSNTSYNFKEKIINGIREVI